MGKKYAVFNEDGLPVAFYDTEIHSDIPKEAILITEDQWLEFINNIGFRKWNFKENKIEVYEPPLPSKEELFESKKYQLMIQENNRLDKILKQFGYLSLSDVQLYANLNDIEAKNILDWYVNYDDLIWQYIENTLPNYTQQELMNLNIIQVEEDIFNKTEWRLMYEEDR